MSNRKKTKWWYVIKPLEKSATILTVRMTQLEKFYECPYAFISKEFILAEESKNNPFTKWQFIYRSGEIFQQWHILHKTTYNYMVARKMLIAQWFQWDELIDRLEKHYWLWKDFIEWFRWRVDVTSILKSYRVFCNHVYLFDDFEYDEYLSEMETSIMYEMWNIWVNLTWTPDHVMFHKEDWHMRIVDLKTCKSKWHSPLTEKWAELYDKRIQRIWYPVSVQFNTLNREIPNNYEFQYLPITKQVKPQITTDFIIPWTLISESEEFMFNLIESFVSAYINERYPTNKWCKRCYYCPLKKNGSCPARADKNNIWF